MALSYAKVSRLMYNMWGALTGVGWTHVKETGKKIKSLAGVADNSAHMERHDP
jgi:hypothetical protein